MTGSENKFESIFVKGKERHLHKGDDIWVKLLMEFCQFFFMHSEEKWRSGKENWAVYDGKGSRHKWHP